MNPPQLGASSRSRTFLLYLLMITTGIVIYIFIRSAGLGLSAPPAPPDFAGVAAGAHGHVNTLLHVLLALLVIVIVARTIGAVFKLIGQPPVIGEVVGGILIGPSVLGRFAPELSTYILPASAAPFLQIIAQIGVILYMFLVGLELDLKVIRRAGHSTLAISHASILLPFLLGAGLALFLYPRLSHDGVGFTEFSLFLGVSMSITAFPVLARILTDTGLQRSRMGAVALTCAAVDDASAWCLLAFVVSIANSRVGDAVRTIALTLAFIMFVVIFLRPLVERFVAWLDSTKRVSQGTHAIAFCAMLVCALVTEYIGIHAIFGAFLLGCIIPHRSTVARDLRHRVEDIVSVLFLPAFFAFTGMRTQIGLVSGAEAWILVGVIIAVACIGKFGGTLVAAKLSGLSWRDSSALGILMNTRGLVELIVLNLGLDLGVLTPKLFTMLVIMALVTTFMTAPIFRHILRGGPWDPEPADEDDEEPDPPLMAPVPLTAR